MVLWHHFLRLSSALPRGGFFFNWGNYRYRNYFSLNSFASKKWFPKWKLCLHCSLQLWIIIFNKTRNTLFRMEYRKYYIVGHFLRKAVSLLLAVSGLLAFIALSHPSELSLTYTVWVNPYCLNLYLHLLHTTVHFQKRSGRGMKINNLASNVIWTKSVDGVGAELSLSVFY